MEPDELPVGVVFCLKLVASLNSDKLEAHIGHLKSPIVNHPAAVKNDVVQIVCAY